jgi:hypothetical protein
MTTTNNPTKVHNVDVPNAGGSARVSNWRGDATKAFYKTSEFMVFIVATVGVLLASYLVQATDGRDDYFRADKAWLYTAILSVGYMVSRGLAKSGSHHHDDV